MTRRAYSKHIPDFRYVTFFSERGTGIVHRANPWTKLALLALVTLVLKSAIEWRTRREHERAAVLNPEGPAR